MLESLDILMSRALSFAFKKLKLNMIYNTYSKELLFKNYVSCFFSFFFLGARAPLEIARLIN